MDILKTSGLIKLQLTVIHMDVYTFDNAVYVDMMKKCFALDIHE